MLICSFSPIQKAFSVGSSLLHITPCLCPIPPPQQSALPGCLGEAAEAWQSDGLDKGRCWQASRGGSRARDGQITLLCGPGCLGQLHRDDNSIFPSDLPTGSAPGHGIHWHGPECVWAKGNGMVVCCEVPTLLHQTDSLMELPVC